MAPRADGFPLERRLYTTRGKRPARVAIGDLGQKGPELMVKERRPLYRHRVMYAGQHSETRVGHLLSKNGLSVNVRVVMLRGHDQRGLSDRVQLLINAPAGDSPDGRHQRVRGVPAVASDERAPEVGLCRVGQEAGRQDAPQHLWSEEPHQQHSKEVRDPAPRRVKPVLRVAVHHGERAHELRRIVRQLQANHAAHREAHHMRRRQVQLPQQGGQVVSHLRDAVGPWRFFCGAVPAQVGRNDRVRLLKKVFLREPVLVAGPEAVHQQ